MVVEEGRSPTDFMDEGIWRVEELVLDGLGGPSYGTNSRHGVSGLL